MRLTAFSVLLLIAICVPVLSARRYDRDNVNHAKQVTFGNFGETGPQPSWDGRWLLFEYFHSEHPMRPSIWIMPWPGHFSEARPLVDDEKYNGEPSWSPDSQWVSFTTDTAMNNGPSKFEISKINVYTGERMRLAQFPSGSGPGDSTSWSVKHKIAFELDGDIYFVEDTGGTIRKLVDIQSGRPLAELSSVAWSPDGNKIVFTAKDAKDQSQNTSVWIVDAATHRVDRLTTGHIDQVPSWVDDKHVVFSRMLSSAQAQILEATITGGSLRVISHGHLDFSPYCSRKCDSIFVARGLPSRPVTNNLNIFEGFHIWMINPTAKSSGSGH